MEGWGERWQWREKARQKKEKGDESLFIVPFFLKKERERSICNSVLSIVLTRRG